MSENRKTTPPAWIGLLLYFGLFFGGGGVGIASARIVAPGVAIAEFVSFLTLPAGFMLGILGWAGAAAPAALLGLFRLLRGEKRKPSDTTPTIPPGTFAFLPAALFTAIPAGILVGLFASDTGFVVTVGVYALLGLAYGVLCWQLAKRGYLPFPQE